ncbi:hypothetical protein [Bacillus sp. TH25]|uniref:hypothetical protein n=1 Tax=Bacillus sp. TH25 TaxID=2796391 RepID=UPI001913F95F|nr:hypothetical protein [Bacillus sp. TH25]MBK5431661.1 hypothetical protein [Bacillus sp. TH25]
MSFNEIADIAKIVGAAVGVLGIIKGFSNLYLEASTTEEFDQLFKDKTKRKQMDIFTFVQSIALSGIFVFILPALYFKFFIPRIPNNYFLILKPLHKGIELSFYSLFLILVIITAILPFIKPKKYGLFCNAIRWLAILNMINFMIFYWAFFNINFNIIQNNKEDFILFVIFIPLFMSFFYKYLNQQLIDKHKTQYLVENLSEEQIEELELIHNFIFDDKRSVLHEKYKEEEGTFYVCDFSSKVYLKYSKMKTRKSSSN